MKKLIFVGILGLFVLGSCNNSTVTHTHDEHDHAAEEHNHEAEGPIIPMKANVAENTIMKQPMNTTKLPKPTVMKSFFRKRKLKQPV